jgi:hypothetical protein
MKERSRERNDARVEYWPFETAISASMRGDTPVYVK